MNARNMLSRDYECCGYEERGYEYAIYNHQLLSAIAATATSLTEQFPSTDSKPWLWETLLVGPMARSYPSSNWYAQMLWNFWSGDKLFILPKIRVFSTSLRMSSPPSFQSLSKLLAAAEVGSYPAAMYWTSLSNDPFVPVLLWRFDVDDG
jgi:hypothetical protein